ncbi:MAG TPA: YeeE/YedE thiosulfate transporter family protein [Casimicrobiaceae bacterium]|nr:YeeE/YedE thiosulfate transporter family protein [Casimicrobiaceae bacterium]
MFPLTSSMELSAVAFLATAFGLGIAFGFVLERAGFGSGCKLTAVFYGYDMAVVKVMFTAIVTAMAGLWALAALGVLDLGEVYVVPTNYTAQIVGGVLMGAGFVVGGYCPGTSVVACATGRIDAMVFIAGLLTGVAAYAQFTPGVETWVRDHAIADLTLPSLTGIPAGWFVLAFVLVLAFAAWLMAWAEQRFAKLRPR